MLTYLMPVMVMAACYSRMSHVLWRSESIGELSQRQIQSIHSKRKVSCVFSYSMTWLNFQITPLKTKTIINQLVWDTSIELTTGSQILLSNNDITRKQVLKKVQKKVRKSPVLKVRPSTVESSREKMMFKWCFWTLQCETIKATWST